MNPHDCAPEVLDTASYDRSPISVVVGASSALLRRGITSLLERNASIAVAAAVVTDAEARDAIRRFEPDVAVLSLHLPSKGALDMLASLVAEPSNTRAVILAAQLNQVDFLRAIELGVRGLVFEEMPAARLVRCVQLVNAGGNFLDHQLVLSAFRKATREISARPDISHVLTAREHAVVEHAIHGLRNKEIARRLGLTEGTVKSHLHRAYHKLHIQGRYALIERTGGMGHVPPSGVGLVRTR